MGFGRDVRLLPRRCRLHRRVAGARGVALARAGPRIIAVARSASGWTCAGGAGIYARGRAVPERARRRPGELTLVSIERRRAFRWLVLPAAQWMMPSAWADASRIASARVWPAQEYTRVIFESASPIEHQLVVLRDPDRVVLDLARIAPSRELDELASHLQRTDPYIAAIRIGSPSDGFLRVVLALKTAVRPQVFSLKPVAEYGHRLVLDLYPLTPVDPLLALLRGEGRDIEARVPDTKPPASAKRSESRSLAHGTPSRRITVALDPGHGGEDPGAIGRRGTYEKNVVLAIGRRLARVLDADSNMRVMLTRNDDCYVPLAERVRKARRVEADLFVSIHADAFRESSARGSSVFALSEHGATSAAARWLAQRENAADLI